MSNHLIWPSHYKHHEIVGVLTRSSYILILRFGAVGDRCTSAELDGRIVGGVEANFNAFPWIAGLVYSNKSVKRPFCGGSLISSSFVLTAAHCVDGCVQ